MFVSDGLGKPLRIGNGVYWGWHLTGRQGGAERTNHCECSRARDATQVLKDNRFRRLILLGDIFADLNFGRLTKEHWKFLGYIRKLSNPKRNVEVTWVEANNPQGSA